jgi:hypothetical protein
MFAVALGGLVINLFAKGDLRYLEDGHAIPAQVLEVVRAPSHIVNGVVTHYGIHVNLSILPQMLPKGMPVDHTNWLVKVCDDPGIEIKTPKFRPGDWVAAVYLPENFSNSLKIYECLDIHPDGGMQAVRPDVLSKAFSKQRYVLIFTACAIAAGYLIAGLATRGFYTPLEFRFSETMLPTIVLAAVIGTSILYLLANCQVEQVAAPHETSVNMNPSFRERVGDGGLFLLILGSYLMSLLASQGMLQAANAWLDSGEARPVPAVVTAIKPDPWLGGLIKSYEVWLACEPLDVADHRIRVNGEAGEQLFTETRNAWASGNTAASRLRVRPGAFGWAWVQGID